MATQVFLTIFFQQQTYATLTHGSIIEYEAIIVSVAIGSKFDASTASIGVDRRIRIDPS